MQTHIDRQGVASTRLTKTEIDTFKRASQLLKHLSRLESDDLECEAHEKIAEHLDGVITKYDPTAKAVAKN